jgi:hypothetical protein
MEMMPPGANGRLAVNPAPSTIPSCEIAGNCTFPGALETVSVKDCVASDEKEGCVAVNFSTTAEVI